MAQKGLHCFVSGRVQGVFFRASTVDQARSLGVTGWTKNLPDGRVEVVAYGDEQSLVLLRNWLNTGPRGARVDDVSGQTIAFKEFDEFEIRY